MNNLIQQLYLPQLILPGIFSFYMQSLEEIEDYCQENLISHIVLLKDIETGTLRVRSLEKERLVLAETCKIFALKYFTFHLIRFNFLYRFELYFHTFGTLCLHIVWH
jgi:hypothetical protein